MKVSRARAITMAVTLFAICIILLVLVFKESSASDAGPGAMDVATEQPPEYTYTINGNIYDADGNWIGIDEYSEDEIDEYSEDEIDEYSEDEIDEYSEDEDSDEEEDSSQEIEF